MNIPPTINNAALAGAVNRRIRADGAMIAAKALLWRMTGVGVFCLLTGCGIGAAFYGYSYVTDSRTSAEKIADAFAQALDHANLGNIRLNPESTVKLDASNAAVKLDPNGATVRLSGDVSIPRPTNRQLYDNQPTNAKVVTNYTIFKQVTYGKARVITGWVFDSSEQQNPTSQFCYYTEQADKTASVRVDLAVNEHALPQLNNTIKLDVDDATAQCVWFR